MLDMRLDYSFWCYFGVWNISPSIFNWIGIGYNSISIISIFINAYCTIYCL